ncbi:MAG: TetR/AcrR family transcriptional regulator [Dokdonella sp.]|nr:MAG: TetR/AcrR family transcriptional regulator [Dokdonella sp.]
MGNSPQRRRTPPATRKRRPPGRPAADGPDLRPRVLDAALACYARHGIAGTSLRAIASEAGVTPALLHYYFGDALRLRQAVVDERVLPAIAAFRAHLALEGEPVALATRFVDGVAALVAAHPWLPALWVREILCEGGALRDLLRQFVSPVPQALAAGFADAQREGRLDPGLDPRLLVVSLVGLTLFTAASAPVWRELLRATDVDDATLRSHTLALLGHGLGVA